MDTDENEQIIPEKTNIRKKRRKKIEKSLLKIEINENNRFQCIIIALVVFIVIILIINIFQLILLYRDMNHLEKRNSKDIINEDNNINIFKEDKNPENQNINNINEVNPEPHKNLSMNITEEIDNFVKTRRQISAKEIADYRLLNSENILYDKIKYRKSESPDVSIIITMSNQAHCIHKALRSVQNQSLKNIEIIISIDCSRDNSTEVIKKYMEEDERIVLIDHERREGIMKTRGDGFKIAKGKYITAVDGDDALIQKDILSDAFYIAQTGDIDIVEFVGAMFVKNKNKGLVHYHGAKGIIGQPELRTKFFNIKEDQDDWRPIVCRSIWAKLIRNSLFQKVLEQVGSKYMDAFMNNYEDTILTVTLFQLAQSYFMFRELGYYYSRDERGGNFPAIPGKTCIIRENINHNMDGLKFLNYLYDNMADNLIERKTLCHEIISINAYEFSNFAKQLNSNFDMLYRVLDGIVDSKYLSEKEREKIKNITIEVKQKEEMVRKNNNR